MPYQTIDRETEEEKGHPRDNPAREKPARPSWHKPPIGHEEQDQHIHLTSKYKQNVGKHLPCRLAAIYWASVQGDCRHQQERNQERHPVIGPAPENHCTESEAD